MTYLKENLHLAHLLQGGFRDAIAGNAKIRETIINFMEQLHKSSLFRSLVWQDIS